jgi:hypothetical protein
VNPNELHAALSSLLNGNDPDTGEEIEVDGETSLVAQCEPAGTSYNIKSIKVIGGRCFLELE